MMSVALLSSFTALIDVQDDRPLSTSTAYLKRLGFVS
jgi:hypothetical protein